LAYHRRKGAGRNFVFVAMAGDVDKIDLAVDYSSIPTMARRAVPMKHEAMLFNDRDEFAKGAF